MNIISQIIAFLHRPFPPTENWIDRIKLAIGISLFVTFFLFIFEPFGLSNIKEHKFWICLGFGATTLFASLFFEIIIVSILGLYEYPQSFTFGKWVLHAIGMILTISIANFMFEGWLQGNLNWRYFPQMIYATFAIGIFPTVVLGSLSMLRQERKYQEIASEIIVRKEEAKETSSEEKMIGDISVSSMRYIESYQNYIKIGYIDSESILKESMKRSTLKSLQSELEGTSIVKCHRSFLVNRSTIISVSGNAQGLLLTLSDCDKQIPVSRSFVSSFR